MSFREYFGTCHEVRNVFFVRKLLFSSFLISGVQWGTTLATFSAEEKHGAVYCALDEDFQKSGIQNQQPDPGVDEWKSYGTCLLSFSALKSAVHVLSLTIQFAGR